MEYLAASMPIIFSGIIILDVGDLFWVAGSNLDEAEDLKKFQDTQNFALREILRDILDKDHARRVASGAITIEDVHPSVREEVAEKLREEEE